MKRVFLAIFAAFVALALAGCASSGQGLSAYVSNWDRLLEIEFDVASPLGKLDEKIWAEHRALSHKISRSKMGQDRITDDNKNFIVSELVLRIEFLRSAVLSYENGTGTQTELLAKYAKNVGAFYKPDPYFTADSDIRTMSDKAKRFSQQIKDFKPDTPLEYYWLIREGRTTDRAFETINSLYSAKRHLKLNENALERVKALFEKKYTYQPPKQAQE